ncbi:MAG TPA: phosphopantetheine-binding protein [Streptosporangiaceae bacterium]
MTAGERSAAGGERAAGDGERPAADGVLAGLAGILARVTGRADLSVIAPETALFGDGVGLDSLTGTMLLVEVQHQFGVDVAAEDLNLDSLATLASLAAFISERLPS